jgi:uncharacterized protein YhaN
MSSSSSSSPTDPDDPALGNTVLNDGAPAGPRPDLPVTEAGERDGAAGLPKESYQTLVAQSVARSRLSEELGELNDRLESVAERIDAVRTLRADLAETEAEIDHLTDRREAAQAALDDAETNREAVEEEQHAKASRGSVLYAALYTVAGLFFVAGDVIMSREIVANALKLRGEVEPWIFAIGLGMLAVLLKPAYDRLVEQPWWKGNETVFAVVISTCAVGVVGTLWVLGAFRSTAFVANAKMQRLTAELMDTSDPARIQEIQQQIGVLQEGLMESPLGSWAFVFSGILFAVAGAVCLGIGIRHLRDAYHLRYRLHRARRRIEDRCADARDALDTLSTQLPEARIRRRRLQQELDDAPALDALRDRRATLRRARRELRDRRANLESLRLQAQYRRNHDRGRLEEADATDAQGPGAEGATRPPPARRNGESASGSAGYIDIRRFLQHPEALNGTSSTPDS